MKYPPLLCKEGHCIYKCFRCEDPNFKGVTECEYIQQEKYVQERIKI